MMNLVLVNDFLNINGGTAQVVSSLLKEFEKRKEFKEIYSIVGTKEDKSFKTFSGSRIKITSVDQEELIKKPNLLLGMKQGLWNSSVKKEIIESIGHLDRKNTIVFIHGYMKILSPYILYLFASLNFKVVIMAHDFFISCPNGAYYNFKTNSICALKPIGVGCLMSNCDSRNFMFKGFRMLRGYVQEAVLRYYRTRFNYIFVSQKLFDTIGKSKKFRDAKILPNPNFSKESQKATPKNNKYFLYVGRFSPEKGFDLIIEWARKLPDVQFKMVGNTEVTVSELPSNLEVHGWLDKEELNKMYLGARCVVVPSKWIEPYGLITREAAKYGLPLLISENMGSSYLVRNNDNGFLIDVNDTEQVLTKIKLLNENNDLISRLGENNFRLSEKSLDEKEEYINSLSEIFAELLTN